VGFWGFGVLGFWVYGLGFMVYGLNHINNLFRSMLTVVVVG
jgi:hypothetical protein